MVLSFQFLQLCLQLRYPRSLRRQLPLVLYHQLTLQQMLGRLCLIMRVQVLHMCHNVSSQRYQILIALRPILTVGAALKDPVLWWKS